MINYTWISFFQDRLLIINVNVRIRLSRSKTAFCLMTDDPTLQMSIYQAVLTVRKVKVNPKIMLAHAAVIDKTTIKYPIRRIETKSFTLNAGLYSKTLDNVSMGPLPKRIVFAFVESKAFNGDLKLNCFNFQHFNLSKVSVTIDGEEAPYSPLEMNFDDKLYQKAYYSLFSGLDRAFLDSGNYIGRKEYAGEYAMFAFDLTPDKCNGDHFNLVKNGNLRISLKQLQQI